VGGEWRPLYRFDLTEQFMADYEVTNWYLCHHPRSHFLSGIMIGRPEPDRRYALGGTSLAVHHLDGPTERRTITDPDDLRTTLERDFRLAVADTYDLEAAFERLR
jgi:arylamine N-acetyltransferase